MLSILVTFISSADKAMLLSNSAKLGLHLVRSYHSKHLKFIFRGQLKCGEHLRDQLGECNKNMFAVNILLCGIKFRHGRQLIKIVILNIKLYWCQLSYNEKCLCGVQTEALSVATNMQQNQTNFPSETMKASQTVSSLLRSLNNKKPPLVYFLFFPLLFIPVSVAF